MTSHKKSWTQDPREALRAGPDFDLASFDRNGHPGWGGDRAEGEHFMKRRGEQMSELQERLFAEGRAGGSRSVLLVLQGLDTAGKGGIVRHVMGMVDPQGVETASFGVPTQEELAHHFLWRIERELPPAGRLGVFDRSHYEDVLVVRVDGLVPEKVWRPRYEEINAWEKRRVDAGTTIIKVALMVSWEEQGGRLRKRLDRPDKHWKFNPGDIRTRGKWSAFQAAYEDVFRYTSTDHAPWYVVPADKKWYSRLAVTEIVTRTLEDLAPQWPAADFDVDEMRRALDALDDQHR